MKVDKYINLKNIVAVVVVHERICEEYVFIEVKKIKWKIFPFWFKRLKSNKWVDCSGIFQENYFDTVQEVIECEKRCDRFLRYDEDKNEFIEKPYIRLTYPNKDYDKIHFETENDMELYLKVLKKLNNDLLKLEKHV